MSPNPFNSGNSFYSGTPDGEPIEPEVQQPEAASAPQYARQAEPGEFAPIGQQQQEATMPGPEVAATVGPPSVSLPLIAVGLFALWMIFKGDMD